jgi:nicotinate-nucleotide adenylyltransferase
MLRLALGGNESFQISECEIERQGISYTVDTLQAIHAERPDDELFLIVGSDALADFGRWKDVPQICQLALPLVAARRGSPADLNQLAAFVSAERLRQAKQFAFEFPLIEVSSTELRERAAAGRSIRYRTPRAVECYIQNARLYQDSSPG